MRNRNRLPSNEIEPTQPSEGYEGLRGYQPQPSLAPVTIVPPQGGTGETVPTPTTRPDTDGSSHGQPPRDTGESGTR